MDTITDDEEDEWNPLINFHHSLKKILRFVDTTTQPNSCCAGDDNSNVKESAAKEDLLNKSATPDERSCEEFDRKLKANATNLLTNKNWDLSTCPPRTHYHCQLHKEPDICLADHYHCYLHEIQEKDEPESTSYEEKSSSPRKMKQRKKANLQSGLDEGLTDNTSPKTCKKIDERNPEENLQNICLNRHLCHLCSSPRVDQMKESDSGSECAFPTRMPSDNRVPNCSETNICNCDGNESSSEESGATFISTYSCTTVPDQKSTKSYNVPECSVPCLQSENDCGACYLREGTFRSPTSRSSSYKSFEQNVCDNPYPPNSATSYCSPYDACNDSASEPNAPKYEIRCIPIIGSESPEPRCKSPVFVSCTPQTSSPILLPYRTHSPSPNICKPCNRSPNKDIWQSQNILTPCTNHGRSPKGCPYKSRNIPPVVDSYQSCISTPKNVTYVISSSSPRARRRRKILKRCFIPRIESEQGPYEVCPQSPRDYSRSPSPGYNEYNYGYNDCPKQYKSVICSPESNRLPKSKESFTNVFCPKEIQHSDQAQKKSKKLLCRYYISPDRKRSNVCEENEVCNFSRNNEYSESECEETPKIARGKHNEPINFHSKSASTSTTNNENEIKIHAPYPVIKICCKHNDTCKCCNNKPEQSCPSKKENEVKVCLDSVCNEKHNSDDNYICDFCRRKRCCYCGLFERQNASPKLCPLCSMPIDIGRHQLQDIGSLCCNYCMKHPFIPVSTRNVFSEYINAKPEVINGLQENKNCKQWCPLCRKTQVCCYCRLTTDICPCPNCTEVKEKTEQTLGCNICTCKKKELPERPCKPFCHCTPNIKLSESQKKSSTDIPDLSFLESPKNEVPSCSSRLWEHFSPMLDILQNEKHCEFTSDITLLFQGNEYPSHKIVLMTFSSYFRDRLMNDPFGFQIDISSLNMTKSGLEAALQWMYTADFTLTTENIGHVWTAARCLGISMLKNHCKQYLRKLIKRDGKLALCKLIGDHRLNNCDVIMRGDPSERKTASGNSEFLFHRPKSPTNRIHHDQGFLEWPVEKAIAYMCKIGGTSEKGQKEIFRMATAWLRHRWPERRCHVTRIMTCIRFAEVPRADVHEAFKQPENQALWGDRRFVSSIILGYLGGAELLFDKKKIHDLSLPLDDQKWTIRNLLPWIKSNLLKERPELFIQGETVRPGILVLINDSDWELMGQLDYELQQNDRILFISTLHGG